MATLVAWEFYCELVGSALYDLLLMLPDAEVSAFDAGFDAEHRGLFAEFYLD